MVEASDFILIAVLGTVGAFISGLLGVGGGIIFIPILDYYLHKTGVTDSELVKFTLANSFFVIVFAGTIISIKQYQSKNFYLKPVIYTALPGMITSVIVTYFIIDGDWYQPEIFKVVFLMMLIPMTIRMFARKEKPTQKELILPRWQSFSITGFFTGIITSLSGLGGGILMVPVFSDLLKLPIKVATSISTGVIPLFTIALIIPYMYATPQVVNPYQIGYIVLPLVAPLIVSVLLISPFGVRIAHTMKPLQLRIIFACISSLIILKELYSYFSR